MCHLNTHASTFCPPWESYIWAFERCLRRLVFSIYQTPLCTGLNNRLWFWCQTAYTKNEISIEGVISLEMQLNTVFIEKTRVKKHASERTASSKVDCWLCHWKPYEGDSSTADRKHEERQACQFSAMAWSWWFTNIYIGGNLQFSVRWGDRLGSTLWQPHGATGPWITGLGSLDAWGDSMRTTVHAQGKH